MLLARLMINVCLSQPTRQAVRGPVAFVAVLHRVDSPTGWKTKPAQTAKARLAEYLTRIDFVVLDEHGLPFAQAGGRSLFHLICRLRDITCVKPI